MTSTERLTAALTGGCCIERELGAGGMALTAGRRADGPAGGGFGG